MPIAAQSKSQPKKPATTIAKAAPPSTASASPIKFPGVPIEPEGYNDGIMFEQESAIFASCDSDNQEAGLKTIMDYVTDRMATMGFVSSEKSYYGNLITNAYKEYVAKTPEIMKDSLARVRFFNSRQNGKIGGDVTQICFAIGVREREWKNGKTWALLRVKANPYGIFRYVDQNNRIAQIPGYNNQGLYNKMFGGIPEGPVKNVQGLVVYHTEDKWLAAKKDGVIPIPRKVTVSPEKTITKSLKAIEGSWVGSYKSGGTLGASSFVLLDLNDYKDAKLSGRIVVENYGVALTVSDVTVEVVPEGFKILLGETVSNQTGERYNANYSPNPQGSSFIVSYTQPDELLFGQGFSSAPNGETRLPNGPVMLRRKQASPPSNLVMTSDFSGDWYGILEQGGRNYGLRMSLKQEGNKLAGISRMTTQQGEVILFDVIGSVSEKAVVITDLKITQAANPSAWCMKTLPLMIEDGGCGLTGGWTGVNSKGRACTPPGFVRLWKVTTAPIQ
jgi:hypothetical protein